MSASSYRHARLSVFRGTLRACSATEGEGLPEAHIANSSARRTQFLFLIIVSFPKSLLLKKKVSTFSLIIPPNSSQYKFRHTDLPQHSVYCPLYRTIIMKPVILAVLLLLADASLASGAPTESGKSRYGDETCLVVILQTLKC